MPNPRSAVVACLLSGLIAAAPIAPAYGARSDFNGAWTVQWCDPDNPGRDCGAFDLYLVQDGDRVCGEHQVATGGLGRLDERVVQPHIGQEDHP